MRLLLLCLFATIAAAGDPSLRELARGDLVITVALPDHERGHYRGRRFDHGGIVTSAVYKGHSFLGLLKPPHDPAKHDGAAGAPEEFDMDAPPGFAAAADGGLFLKIGVGALVRPDRKDYRFSRDYAVSAWAAWTVAEQPGEITCTHTAAAGALAVRGSRTIRLLPEGDGFTIERQLVNTGTAELPVEHYNHTMVIIDGEPIGPGYRLTFPAPVQVAHRRLAGAGAEVTFPEPLPKGASAYSAVGGLPAGAAAATVRIARGDLALELSGDTAPAKVAIYAEATALCPEFFVRFTLPPGGERRWSQTYRFRAP